MVVQEHHGARVPGRHVEEQLMFALRCENNASVARLLAHKISGTPVLTRKWISPALPSVGHTAIRLIAVEESVRDAGQAQVVEVRGLGCRSLAAEQSEEAENSERQMGFLRLSGRVHRKSSFGICNFIVHTHP